MPFYEFENKQPRVDAVRRPFGPNPSGSHDLLIEGAGNTSDMFAASRIRDGCTCTKNRSRPLSLHGRVGTPVARQKYTSRPLCPQGSLANSFG